MAPGAGPLSIAWDAPWLQGWRQPGEPVARHWGRGLAVREALMAEAAPGGPRFVSQAELPEGMAYERFIFDTGQVPTRDNLHDFFNGLCWRRFPLAKRALNRLQADAIARDGVRQTRGPLRDSLTLFDENAALLQAPQELWQALEAREWRRLFVELRPLWSRARLVLFGHALLEKLVDPYKSITAHVFRLPVPPSVADDSGLDRWLCAQITPQCLGAKPYTPLPVLGVPGWWAANEDPTFYEDTTVFRPPRA